jgi:hypothetical protein
VTLRLRAAHPLRHLGRCYGPGGGRDNGSGRTTARQAGQRQAKICEPRWPVNQKALRHQ